jgi:hypothetical protein
MAWCSVKKAQGLETHIFPSLSLVVLAPVSGRKCVWFSLLAASGRGKIMGLTPEMSALHTGIRFKSSSSYSKLSLEPSFIIIVRFCSGLFICLDCFDRPLHFSYGWFVG